MSFIMFIRDLSLHVHVFTTVVVRSAVTDPDSSQVLSTLRYHAADKHDTPPSHFKLTLGQPALF